LRCRVVNASAEEPALFVFAFIEIWWQLGSSIVVVVGFFLNRGSIGLSDITGAIDFGLLVDLGYTPLVL
jgi:hypothetical protein